MTPFQYLDEAKPHELGRAPARNVHAFKAYASAADLSALGGQEIGDAAQGGGLAGAIRAEKRHDLAASHAQADAMEGDDRMVVDDLETVDDQWVDALCHDDLLLGMKRRVSW